ncbi:MAG: hypothetical protein E7536_04680 [Ruminococcaceae bacterium]|nr:hypothetical protein [Oscillospiraceae bacterium]
MDRTVKNIPNFVDPQVIFNSIYNYLIGEGCKYVDYQGEKVFKKGKGFFSGPTFIKVSATGNMFQIEGWMKYALLPGVYVGEINLEGFAGSAVRGPVLNRMNTVEQIIINANLQAQQQGQYTQQSYAQQPYTQMPNNGYYR